MSCIPRTKDNIIVWTVSLNWLNFVNNFDVLLTRTAHWMFVAVFSTEFYYNRIFEYRKNQQIKINLPTYVECRFCVCPSLRTSIHRHSRTAAFIHYAYNFSMIGFPYRFNLNFQQHWNDKNKQKNMSSWNAAAFIIIKWQNRLKFHIRMHDEMISRFLSIHVINFIDSQLNSRENLITIFNCLKKN